MNSFLLYLTINVSIATIDKLGLDPIKYGLEQIGQWPIFDPSSIKKTDYDWIGLLGKIADIGLDPNILFWLEPTVNYNNFTSNILMVSVYIINTIALYEDPRQ